jgi:hypothetical protein
LAGESGFSLTKGRHRLFSSTGQAKNSYIHGIYICISMGQLPEFVCIGSTKIKGRILSQSDWQSGHRICLQDIRLRVQIRSLNSDLFRLVALCVQLFVYKCIGTYVYKYIQMCTNIYICVQIYTYVYKYIQMCTNIYICVQIYTYVYKYIHRYVYKCIHMCTNVHMYGHLHVFAFSISPQSATK